MIHDAYQNDDEIRYRLRIMSLQTDIAVGLTTQCLYASYCSDELNSKVLGILTDSRHDANGSLLATYTDDDNIERSDILTQTQICLSSDTVPNYPHGSYPKT
jgi:hypothetical protein